MPTLPRFEITFESGKLVKELYGNSRFFFTINRSALCRLWTSAIAAFLVLRHSSLMGAIACVGLIILGPGGEASPVARGEEVLLAVYDLAITTFRARGVVHRGCTPCPHPVKQEPRSSPSGGSGRRGVPRHIGGGRHSVPHHQPSGGSRGRGGVPHRWCGGVGGDRCQ